MKADRRRTETGPRVRALFAAGVARADIARQLGISKPTVTYHLKRGGVPRDERSARRYDWASVQAYYDEGHSITECQLRFGFARASFVAAQQRGLLVARPSAMPIEELLVVGRETTRTHLRRRLIRAGLKRAECESCGITDWRGRELSLELHHINGNGRDNRLENLMILCPNCHSQTDTWGGRNRGRVQRP